MTLPTLSQEQANVVNYLNRTQEHIFVTGKAGTGKSVVLRAFRESTHKKVLICAPTGVAALNVEGMTLHNLIGLKTGLPSWLGADISEIRRKRSVLLEADAIVIDEVSMVSSEMMDSIDIILRQVREDDQPFGGLQIIMFGDPYQLPPVKTKEFEQFLAMECYRSAWFFDAHVWEETEFHTFGLSKVHRQADGAFKDILNAVRDGTVTDKQIAELNDLGRSPRTEKSLLLGARKKIVNDFNAYNLKKLKGSPKVYTARVHRGWGLMDPAERRILLKPGAHIMMLSNDRDGRWVNGSLATLKSCDLNSLWVETEDGYQHEVVRHQWVPAGTMPEQFQEAPKFVQFPVKLAWGITIHKSQGLTKNDVEIDLGGGAFEAGQTYVALSRVTSPEGLHLRSPLKKSDIWVDPHVHRFFAEL